MPAPTVIDTFTVPFEVTVPDGWTYRRWTGC